MNEIKIRTWNQKDENFTYTYINFPENSMRFTGLKDEKNTEIYEGDIIKIGRIRHYDKFHISSDLEDCTGKVEFFKNDFFVNLPPENWAVELTTINYAHKVYVIGNIFSDIEK